MFSRIFISGNLQRAIVAVALLVSISATAVAQYGSGGTGATPTYPGGAHPSYGSKGAVIGVAVAGAAVGAAYFTGSFTIEPSCRAAWLVMGTGLSMKRTIKPTASATRRTSR